ncbi:MAG TPA: single-stranded-DNA-specific exonuclease RecJ [Chloroflexi bacterium]|nr:single-stranded-DNA-specific exonuclease RecJ [Chloroflexota bacterium]
MPKNWIEPLEISVSEALSAAVGGHPLVVETLTRRGFSDPKAARAFLDPAQYTSSPATAFPDIPKAVERLWQAIEGGETILVWGDFDVDGQTSTTLLVEALQDLGARVAYHIPVRATEGHGIKVEVLAGILSATALSPTILLTCDTGIAAHEAVEYAQFQGLDAIITDHHDLPEELPPAFATINPKLLPEGHPLSTLPGVGVAYKLVEALYSSQPSAVSAQQLDKYLDLVALGIVADVAEQTGDTRYLLQSGLKVLRNTPRLGLQTLMELAQIIPAQLDESTIGFGIGPRLNALGRLADANPIVEFLTTDDAVRTRVTATQLEGLNERRKLLTEQITQAALTQIEQDPALLKPAGLVLAHAGWHTGVIGIVASRLVEQFNKPTILLSIGDDGLARGSARSAKGIHITEAIATQREILTGFGGHPGAAGLSLPEEMIPQFRRGFGQAIRAQVGDQPSEAMLQIDATLPLAELSLDLVDEIERLAPFGNGNPPLTLASHNLKLISQTPIGRGKEHLRLVVADENDEHLNVLWWNGAGNPLPEAETLFDLAYTIQANSFRGERQLQIQWVDYRPSITASGPEFQVEVPILEVVDLRGEANPLARVKSIQAKIENLQIWAEGEAKSRLGGHDRNELLAGENLVVWTAPPGPREWQAVLDVVQPQKIYVFAVDPQMDAPKTFLPRLAGLVKFALRSKSGEVDLEKAAAATAQQGNTVRMGLLWLEAKGLVQVTRREETVFSLAPGEGVERVDLAEIGAELEIMLKETAAYRAYFKKT